MPHIVEPDVRKAALSRLIEAGVPFPASDVDRFLEHLEKNKTDSMQASDEFLSMIGRRCLREPIERIMGYASFHNKDYRLHPSVFRPVSETETTLEYALLCAQKFDRPIRILDLGCGNGCMLISLLLELEDATGVGIDVNPDAIDLSIQNARVHNVQDRAEFIVSDWANDLNQKFDIIISNPPRIANSYLDKLVLEVSKYDPVESLAGGGDGLEFYKRTVDIIPSVGNTFCYIVMQAGHMVSQRALEIFQYAGYKDSQICRDFKFQPNCIVLSNKTSPRKLLKFSSFLRLIDFLLPKKMRSNYELLHYK